MKPASLENFIPFGGAKAPNSAMNRVSDLLGKKMKLTAGLFSPSP